MTDFIRKITSQTSFRRPAVKDGQAGLIIEQEKSGCKRRGDIWPSCCQLCCTVFSRRRSLRKYKFICWRNAGFPIYYFRKKRNQHGILPVWLYPAIIFCTSRRTADKPLNRPAERKIRPAQLDKSRMGQQIALRQTAVISYQKDKAVPGRYFYSENQGK